MQEALQLSLGYDDQLDPVGAAPGAVWPGAYSRCPRPVVDFPLKGVRGRVFVCLCIPHVAGAAPAGAPAGWPAGLTADHLHGYLCGAIAPTCMKKLSAGVRVNSTDFFGGRGVALDGSNIFDNVGLLGAVAGICRWADDDALTGRSEAGPRANPFRQDAPAMSPPSPQVTSPASPCSPRSPRSPHSPACSPFAKSCGVPHTRRLPYCSPGEWCWSCCGAGEEGAAGCALQKALRRSPPVLLQPALPRAAAAAPGVRLSPDPPGDATAADYASVPGVGYRVVTAACEPRVGGVECVAFELLVEQCGPAAHGEHITVGVATAAWVAEHGDVCHDYLGGSEGSIGWWSESDLVAGMGRRERTRELGGLAAGSGRRARYRSGDAVGIVVDCLNKEITFFSARVPACVVKLPGVLGVEPVLPA
eukprot:gene6439-20942_t